jgi:protein-S-isoprenylcysteine O-methyltransferase Ste14
MGRYFAFAFGVSSYGIFFVTFLYLIGFLANAIVPKGIDSGTPIDPIVALVVNLGLIALFGVQHSVMARPAFKAVWTKIVPKPIERSTYVLLASLVLVALYVWWQPMPTVLWQATTPVGAAIASGVFLSGIGLVLVATFVINHFDLFGLRQVFLHLRNQPYAELPFQVRFLYRLVRHPLYVGWFVAFWATPVMTVGHLLFAAGMSIYILIAVRHEERDLVRHLGEDYRRYQRHVPRFVPRLGTTHAAVKPGTKPQTAASLRMR